MFVLKFLYKINSMPEIPVNYAPNIILPPLIPKLSVEHTESLRYYIKIKQLKQKNKTYLEVTFENMKLKK